MNRYLLLAIAPIAMSALACSANPLEWEEEVSESTEAIFPIGFGSLGAPSVQTAVASRGPLLLDMFTLNTNFAEVVYHRHANGWQPPVSMGKPPGVSTVGSIAVVNNGGRLDLFAHASDGKIYHRFSNHTTGIPTFTPWGQVPGVTLSTATGNPDRIAVTSWEPGRLDLFWLTSAGNIGHKWATGYVWQGQESGDTGVPYLQPTIKVFSNLEAVSARPGRIDIVLAGTLILGFQHHWYDSSAGHWGSGSTLHRQTVNCSPTCSNVKDISIMPNGTNGIEVFVKHDANSTAVDGLMRMPLSFPNTWLFPDDAHVNMHMIHLSDGHRAGSIREVFGWANGTAWLAQF
jgi:hypothetical protein